MCIRDSTMEGRLTLCNLSIEMGARGGMIAPDEVTFEYIKAVSYTHLDVYKRQSLNRADSRKE